MRRLYNILFSIFFWLSAPYYFLKMRRRGNWRPGFNQRFGKYSAKVKQAITNRHVMWIHAVSVGEVNICTQLIRALEPRLPNLKIVVSTTTTTGMNLLQNMLPSHVEKIYYPIDRRRYVSRAFSVIHPEAMVLVEAEIWPNMIWRLKDRKVPLFLVNARLSDRSYRGYRRFGFLFNRLFEAFAGVGAQTEEDAQKLRDLGCRPEAVHVVGSLKYDAARVDERRMIDVAAMLRQIGAPEDAVIWVAGSTHAGEEALIGAIFKKLRTRFPKLFLIVVPRHFERGKEAGRDLEKLGIRFLYRSLIHSKTRKKPGEIDCLLVNSTGELKFFYEHASLVFVGKSLTAQGGQNPIEPASLGKPVVFGPNMQNFADVVSELVKGGGSVQVANEAELESAVARILDDEAYRVKLGKNAADIARKNLGAIGRTVDMIVEQLKGEEIYVR